MDDVDNPFDTSLFKNVWNEYELKADTATRLNNMHRTLQGLQADVAVLIDAVLRKDAEADELRARIIELETRIVSLETSQVRTYTWPITSPTFKLTTTTDGTDDGTAKL